MYDRSVQQSESDNIILVDYPDAGSTTYITIELHDPHIDFE